MHRIFLVVLLVHFFGNLDLRVERERERFTLICMSPRSTPLQLHAVFAPPAAGLLASQPISDCSHKFACTSTQREQSTVDSAPDVQACTSMDIRRTCTQVTQLTLQ